MDVRRLLREIVLLDSDEEGPFGPNEGGPSKIYWDPPSLSSMAERALLWLDVTRGSIIKAAMGKKRKEWQARKKAAK